MEKQNNELFEYINIIKRRKWLLILPTMVGLALAAYIGMMLPAYYKSTTLILVERQKIPQSYVTPTDSTPFEQRLSTIKQQVMSRTNLERIIGDFNLYRKDEIGDLKKWVNGKAGSEIFQNAGAAGLAREEIIERMREDIEVDVIGKTRDGGGDAFRISYIGRDPYITMQVANTLSSLFIEENLKIKEQYAEGTSEFLEKELEKAKAELESREKSLREFKERHIGALPEQLEANLRTLDRLQLELQSVIESVKNAEEKKLLLEGQLAAFSRDEIRQQVTISAADSTAVSGTAALEPEEELRILEHRLATLLSIYRENYPDVVIVKNRVEELRARVAERRRENSAQDKAEPAQGHTSVRTVDNREAKIHSDLDSVRLEIAALKERANSIRSQIGMYEKRVEVTPANEQKLADLTRDYNMMFENYQTLLGKKLNARLAENLEKKQKGATFRVIDPANLPEKPFKPDRIKIAIFGVMLGGGIGAGLIMILEMFNPAFRRPEDLIGVIEAPVLASIPRFQGKKPVKDRIKRLKVIKGAKGG